MPGVGPQSLCVVDSSTIAQCFPDPNLAAVVAEITTGSAANTNDVLSTYKINRTVQVDAEGKSISDLTGLEYLTNVQRLYLADNNISAVPQISSLTKLTTVDLSGNHITDVTPLDKIVNINSPRFGSHGAELVTLNLANNRISDVTHLKLDNSTISNLVTLNLSGNAITDVTPLAGLYNVTSLNLAGNRVTDLRPFARPNPSDIPLRSLTNLNLSNNGITDANGLQDLTAVNINLAGNHISDSSVFAGKYSGDLNLDGNQISDITPFKTLIRQAPTVGGTVTLSHNRLLDVSPLNDIPDVSSVILTDQDVTLPNAGPVTSLSLTTAKTKCGAYLTPSSITPSSGVYDSASGTVTWRGLSRGTHTVSLTFDDNIPCACTPGVRYNGSITRSVQFVDEPPALHPQGETPAPGATPSGQGPARPGRFANSGSSIVLPAIAAIVALAGAATLIILRTQLRHRPTNAEHAAEQ